MREEHLAVHKEALEAYRDVWRKHQVSFCPPVLPMKDRVWSEHLRAMWPDYSTVDVKTSGGNHPNYREMRVWCDNQKSGYWTNGGGNRWYFERRDIAALFKLTFGGA